MKCSPDRNLFDLLGLVKQSCHHLLSFRQHLALDRSGPHHHKMWKVKSYSVQHDPPTSIALVYQALTLSRTVMSFDKHQMQAVNMALHEVRISRHSVTMWHQHVSMVAARRLKRFIRPKHRVRNAAPRVKPGSAPHHFSRHLPKIHTRQAAITRIFSKTLQVAGCSGYIHTDFTVPTFRLAVASCCPWEDVWATDCVAKGSKAGVG